MSAASSTQRRQVEVSKTVDDRIYGPLPGAIAYLQELLAENPNQTLYFGTDGYDRAVAEVIYRRPETDEEFEDRIDVERQQRERDDENRKRIAARAKAEAEIKRLQQELRRL